MMGAVPRGFSPWKMSQSTLIKTTINQLSLFCTLKEREREGERRRKKGSREYNALKVAGKLNQSMKTVLPKGKTNCV